MIKRTAFILSAATLSFGLALAPTSFAQDAMKKDSMSKDSMSKEAMSKDFDVEGQHEEGRYEEELGAPRRTRLRFGASAAPR